MRQGTVISAIESVPDVVNIREQIFHRAQIRDTNGIEKREDE